MEARTKFPIRAKLLLLIVMVVLLAIASYLILAIKLFKDDKTSLVYELNASTVKTMAAETQSDLLKVIDKVQLLTRGYKDPTWVRAVFEAEPDIIAYTLYQPRGKSWKPISQVRNRNYLRLYDLSRREIDRVRRLIPIPFGRVLTAKTLVFNSTLPKGAPILTVALAIKGKKGRTPEIAVVDMRMDRIIKLLSETGIATTYLIDYEGRIVAHKEKDLIKQRALQNEVPIVNAALASKVPFELKRFSWQDAKWIGAYAAVGVGGLKIISQIPESVAFQAAGQLITKSILLGLLIITVALGFANWLSKTFTGPLYQLVHATERLAKWNFGQPIRVRTNDEIGSLAGAFNVMAGDLQKQYLQIEAHQRELEQKVKERTAALETQKKKAAEAQEALLRTTRLAALGELAGSAAHEVLNPINNMNIRVNLSRDQILEEDRSDINLFTEIIGGWKKSYDRAGWTSLQEDLGKPVTEGQPKTLLQEDLENLTNIATDVKKRVEARNEDLQFLNSEIVRITKIINNMRTLSRVGGEKRPVQINVPIEETLVAMHDLFEKIGVRIEKKLGQQPMQIIADKDELVQVFSNLMRNSLQAIEKIKEKDLSYDGSIEILSQQTNDRIEVRFKDNGAGFTDEAKLKAFETDFTTKPLDKGTGLGMSISRRLVRAFDGDIEIENTAVGSGSTILVWFPVKESK